MMCASPIPIGKFTLCAITSGWQKRKSWRSVFARLTQMSCNGRGCFVTPDNVAQYMSVGYSYVIDAIHSVRPKAALIAYCRRNKIPLVTTGGAGGQIDPTQIQVTDLAKTIQDPLAAKLRERLKSDFGVVKNSKGKLGVDCVFSTEALVYPQSDGTVCAMKATAEGPKRMDCASGFGAATMVTATLGLLRFLMR
ncbi:hypothetical protein ACNKHL_17055 [Shigella flexneri]